MPVTARSKPWVCGGSFTGIADSNPDGDMDVCCVCCVLSGRGLCAGLIDCPEGSYRLWCVSECYAEGCTASGTWPTVGCWNMKNHNNYKNKFSPSAICFDLQR
jgi:hypothetical protein